ncbi:MAG: PD-(D/E)XK nuclease family protein [Candidatus Shapirobacteria bacterium]|nr:PD-(D/E)XK nuclease family protein [Candidatus Shapirobacteria bacterium]
MRLSRSKIDLYLNCPKCFYLDVKKRVKRPPGFPFTINSEIDRLLKNEFDIHRAKHTTHPLMKAYGVEAVPFEHPKMDEWRDSLRRGITYPFPETDLIITGGVDDIWVNQGGQLIIVDYKATAKVGEVNLDADWQIGYKRQMEIYQWLFRKNGFEVAETGYFVYCNGRTTQESFDAKLEFDIKLIPYRGNPNWVDETVKEIWQCLCSEIIPDQNPECEYCNYANNFGRVSSKEIIIEKKIEQLRLG